MESAPLISSGWTGYLGSAISSTIGFLGDERVGGVFRNVTTFIALWQALKSLTHVSPQERLEALEQARTTQLTQRARENSEYTSTFCCFFRTINLPPKVQSNRRAEDEVYEESRNNLIREVRTTSLNS